MKDAGEHGNRLKGEKIEMRGRIRLKIVWVDTLLSVIAPAEASA